MQGPRDGGLGVISELWCSGLVVWHLTWGEAEAKCGKGRRRVAAGALLVTSISLVTAASLVCICPQLTLLCVPRTWAEVQGHLSNLTACFLSSPHPVPTLYPPYHAPAAYLLSRSLSPSAHEPVLLPAMSVPSFWRIFSLFFSLYKDPLR